MREGGSWESLALPAEGQNCRFPAADTPSFGRSIAWAHTAASGHAGAAFTGLACPPPVAAFASRWRSGRCPLLRLARRPEPGTGLAPRSTCRGGLGERWLAESAHGRARGCLVRSPPPALETPASFQLRGGFAFHTHRGNLSRKCTGLIARAQIHLNWCHGFNSDVTRLRP